MGGEPDNRASLFPLGQLSPAGIGASSVISEVPEQGQQVIDVTSLTPDLTLAEAIIEFLSEQIRILGDGNCLCRALAFIQYGDDNRYMDVKKAVANALPEEDLIDVYCANPGTLVYNARELNKDKSETPLRYLQRCICEDKMGWVRRLSQSSRKCSIKIL